MEGVPSLREGDREAVEGVPSLREGDRGAVEGILWTPGEWESGRELT